MLRSPLLLLTAAVLLGGEAAAPAIPEAYAAYATQARELAPAGTARPAAIAAVHAFVRDLVLETPTSWG